MQRGTRKRLISIVGVAILLSAIAGGAQTNDAFLSKPQKIALVNTVGCGAILYWGIRYWDYEVQDPQVVYELWFGQDTANGGVDKLGHFYCAYIGTHMLTELYDVWGFDRDDALVAASWSAFGIMSFMEVGDAFSHHGLCPEDIMADGLGCIAGYLTYRYPSFGAKVDFRVQFLPERRNDLVDFFTTYHRMKHLVAIKASGFKCLNRSCLRYLEFHLGYYTRHFQESRYTPEYRNRHRDVYVGLGLNVTRIINDLTGRDLPPLFDYYQLPFAYVSADRRLERD